MIHRSEKMKEIKEAYQQCGQIVGEYAPACFKALSYLPLKQRQASWAVLSFCHTAASADEKVLSAFEAKADHVYQRTNNGNQHLWKAFDHAYRTFTLESEPFREFIAAQKEDAKPYDDLDELLMYAYRTGGAAGLMLLPILTRRKQDQLKQAAVSLGLAVQLVRFLSDLGTDQQKNRIPLQVMQQFGYTEADLQKGTVNKAFTMTWEYIAFEAEAYLEECQDALPLFPQYSQKTVKAALHLHRAVLEKIRAKQHDVFQHHFALTETEVKQILSDI
ncbi:farnesyl diphosphate phosphatase [Bacillus subtilis]|uniref:farnesyl diphosphate phosphatase n=1 Tax=Bacillus subtilis TaxID=1423 RepID=UPI001C249A7B|nr:farnesyl diphosphate phosphatase [Bacillus subtilis]